MSIISVRLVVPADGSERVSHVIGEEILQFPGQFIEHVEQLAKELVPSGSHRLTYIDSEGDACTLTRDTVKDALCFTKSSGHEDQFQVLELEVAASPEPTPESLPTAAGPVTEQSALACAMPGCSYRAHSNPAFGGFCCRKCPLTKTSSHGHRCEKRPMKEGDGRATAKACGEASSVPNEKGHGKGKGHGHGFGHHWLHHFKRHFGAGIGGCGNGTSGVHHNVVCDGCEQSPIVGTRFKSLEWDDYDLCEQCHRSRVDALGVPGDHQFQAIEPPQRGQWRCGGADFFDRILERLEEDPVAFYSNVSQMFDLQTMARKFAEVAIEVVVEMDKEELFGLLDPLSKISEEEVDERNFPEQARNIASIIHAAPEAVQSELKQRFCASAMKVFQTAGMGWHKGWGKGWKGCKGWKGWKGCKGAAKGWHKGARTSEQEPAPEAKRHCPTRSSTSDSVHENAISMLMSHPDAKIREAANMAMRQAEESMSSADVPTQKSSMPDPKPETSSGATASLSASLMGIPSVEVHSSAIQVDVSVAGDVSSAWMPILSQFPLLTTAVLLGHVACDSSSGPAEMLVHLSLVNDSCVPWPAETNLRIAAGDPFGCEVITVGEIPSGDVFQTVMKLNIPHAGGPSRSAWALESHGEPFGPMLILELQPIS